MKNIRTKTEQTIGELLTALGFEVTGFGGDTTIYSGNGKEIEVRSIPGAAKLYVDDKAILSQNWD